MPQYFRGIFLKCIGAMPVLDRSHILLVWILEYILSALDKRGVLLAAIRNTMVAPTVHWQARLVRPLACVRVWYCGQRCGYTIVLS